jgi:predicted alpha/beta hydrolase
MNTMRRVRIPSDDGLELAATVFGDDTAALGRAVLILGSVGARQERYAEFARFLADAGWCALTFDYRGIGRSSVNDAARNEVSMQAWGERDLAAMIAFSKVALGARRLAVVCHSIGGQLMPLAANQAEIDAVLAVAVQKGHWRLWDGPNKYLVYGFFRYYIPVCLRLFGRVPLRWVGLDSLESNAARDYARWTLQLDYTAADGTPLTPSFASFQSPILALSFADDTRYAPPRAVDFLMRHYYLRAPVWRCHIHPAQYGLSGLGHSGFFDPLQCPSTFWEETSAWLEHAAEGRPLQDYRFSVLRAVEPLLDKQPLDTITARAANGCSDAEVS